MAVYGYQIKKLRTDSASEFAKDIEFKKWLLDNRITQEMSAPYTKHQNRVVKRHIQTIKIE